MRAFAALVLARDLLEQSRVTEALAGRTALELFCDCLETYRPEPFWVALDGTEDEEVKRLLSHKPLTFLQLEDEQGADYSREDWLRLAQARLATMNHPPSGLLYLDCSHPYMQQESLRSLIERALERPDESCWPLNQSREGSACYLSLELLDALQESDLSLSELRFSGQYPCAYLFTGDSGVWRRSSEGVSGLKRPGEQRAMQRLRPRFVLACEENYYGPGPHLLLKLVSQGLSLRAACREMNLSYTKGRYMVAGIERNLGCPILISYQGGKEGGKSELTACGLALVDCYEAFLRQAEQETEALFQAYFQGFFEKFAPEGLTETD